MKHINTVRARVRACVRRNAVPHLHSRSCMQISLTCRSLRDSWGNCYENVNVRALNNVRRREWRFALSIDKVFNKDSQARHASRYCPDIHVYGQAENLSKYRATWPKTNRTKLPSIRPRMLWHVYYSNKNQKFHTIYTKIRHWSLTKQYTILPPSITNPSLHNTGFYTFRPLLRAIIRQQNTYLWFYVLYCTVWWWPSGRAETCSTPFIQ
jgi:hypothetical protein